MLPRIKQAFGFQLSAIGQTGNSLVILLLIAGLITGGLLLENKYGKGLPASHSPTPVPVEYTASLTLTTDKELAVLKSGDSFAVMVNLSTKEAVNLISTKIHYPKDQLKVTSIDDLKDQSPISLWVSKDDFPDEGKVQLVGGVPNPGLQTSGEVKPLVAINFQIIRDNNGFEIKPEEVQLYSNSTNQPLENVQITGLSTEKPIVSPVESLPSPVTSPSITPQAKGVLSLSPKILQSSNGCTFDVVLSYDSGGNDFVGIDALLTIDPRVLTPISVQRTNTPPDGIFAPQLAFKNDTITLAYLSPGTRPYQKKAELGKITFKVTDQPAQGMTAIKIKYNPTIKNNLADSNILASLKDDVLSDVNNSFVLIKPGSCNQEKTFEVLPNR
jgi:hypothetical protein